MSLFYTLPEIARLTGIPLVELEQYECEFRDLLPEPRWFVAVVPVEPPRREAVAEFRPRPPWWAEGWALFERLRQAWRRWCAALRRAPWRPAIAGALRLFAQWRQWQRAWEPA